MVQETKNLTRNSFIDIVSGLFVVEIIIEHLLQNAEIAEGSFYSDYVVRFFSAFMPWFYFKAGMMFKEVYWKDGILKRVKKLFYPFITWSVVGSLLIFPLALINSDIIWWGKKILSAFFYGQGAHNVPLWFLLSLFFVYIIVYIRVIKVSWTHIIILGVLSWLFNLIPYKLPMGLSNLTLGALFFVLGAKFNSLKISHPKYWVAVLSGVYVSLVSLYYSQFNFRWNRLQDGGSLDGGGYFM